MRIKYILFLFLVFVFSIDAFAQSITFYNKQTNVETSTPEIVYGEGLSYNYDIDISDGSTKYTSGTLTIKSSNFKQILSTITITNGNISESVSEFFLNYHVTGETKTISLTFITTDNQVVFDKTPLSIKVVQRPLYIDPNNPGFVIEKTYDGSTDIEISGDVQFKAAESGSGIVNSDEVTTSCTSAAYTGSDVDSYVINPSYSALEGANASDYYLPVQNINVTISKVQSLPVTWSLNSVVKTGNISYTYTDTHNIVSSISSSAKFQGKYFVSSYEYSSDGLTWKTYNNDELTPGTYKLRANFSPNEADKNNFEAFTTDQVSLVVEKLTPKAKINGQTFVYGSKIKDDIYFSCTNKLSTSDLQFTYTLKDSKGNSVTFDNNIPNFGTYTFHCDVSDNNGLMSDASFEDSFTITPAPITLSLNKTEFEYTESALLDDIKFIATVEVPTHSEVNISIESVLVDGTEKSQGDMINAGNHTAKVTFKSENSNYSDDTQSLTFSVTTKDMNLRLSDAFIASDKSKVYDGTTTFTSKVSNPIIYTILDKDKSAFSLTSVPVEYDSKKVGSRTLVFGTPVFQIIDKTIFNNYTFESISDVVKTTITAKYISIDDSYDTEKNYDGTTSVNNYVLSDSWKNYIVSGDDVKISSSAIYESSEIANPQPILLTYELSGSDANNYYISDSNPLKLELEDSEGKILGKFSVSLDKLEYTYGAQIGGTDSDKDIIFTSSDTRGLADLEFTYYLDGVKVDKNSYPNSGEHKIYCSVVDKNGVYQTLEKSDEYTILVNPICLDLLEPKYDFEKVYDRTTSVICPSSSQHVDNILPKDRSNVIIETSATYDDPNYGFDHVITIKNNLNLSGDAVGNYILADDQIEYAGSTPGTIKPLTGTLVFTGSTVEYGNSEFGTDIKPTNIYTFNNGDQVTLDGEYTYTYSNHDFSDGNHLDVGTYKVRANFETSDDNYASVSSDWVQFVVTPKHLIVSENAIVSDKVYDGTTNVNSEQVTLPKLEGVVYNDVIDLTYDASTLKYPKSECGEYDLTLDISIVDDDGDDRSDKTNNYVLDTKQLSATSSIITFDFVYNISADESGVYYLTYGNSVLGQDIQVVNELSANQQIKYFVSDIDKTNGILVPKTDAYEVNVVLYEFENVVKQETILVYVNKLKLQVSEPEISHVKVYDGTNRAVLTGSNCVLTNVVGSDNVLIEKQTQLYDNEEIASGKTITVSFKLSGAALDRYYIEPDPIVYTDGVITSDDMKIRNLAADAGVCPGNEASISFEIVSGVPVNYNINFSQDALNLGFVDLSDKLPNQFGDVKLTLNIPEKTPHSTISATLVLSDASGKEYSYPFTFDVDYGADIIVTKFNDVIAIDNSSMQFHGYQWIKDGEIVDGETRQFFNDLPYLKGWYSANVYTVDGSMVKVCPVYIDKSNVSKSAKRSVNVYPNPASALETVTIDLTDFNLEDYENCKILIYNSMGSLCLTINNVDAINTVNLPSGYYTGIVFIDNSKFNFKIIVRN